MGDGVVTKRILAVGALALGFAAPALAADLEVTVTVLEEGAGEERLARELRLPTQAAERAHERSQRGLERAAEAGGGAGGPGLERAADARGRAEAVREQARERRQDAHERHGKPDAPGGGRPER
jgi:hypothetical protein